MNSVTFYLKTKTIATYTENLHRINQAIDGQPINRASADAIAQALDSKTTKLFTLTFHGEPLAPSSVISYRRTLSSVLARAVKWGYVRSNPADAKVTVHNQHMDKKTSFIDGNILA